MRIDEAVVCDASVLAAISFAEPQSLEARSLTRSRRLFAPPLLQYELAQTAASKCLRDPERASWTLRAFAAGVRVPVTLVQPSWPEVVELARESRLSAYDASYLQLALALGIGLVTLDRRLARSAEALGASATA
jgi:predicted nucleic acid-binding protein